jgi:hypothetical protein
MKTHGQLITRVDHDEERRLTLLSKKIIYCIEKKDKA